MNNEDLIDDWDEADFEIFKQWDEEAKNKRLEELDKQIQQKDVEIAKLLIRIDGLNYSLEQAYKEIKNLEKYYDIIKEAIDYIEHISNVDIDWHEQDRIINILRKCDNE